CEASDESTREGHLFLAGGAEFAADAACSGFQRDASASPIHTELTVDTLGEEVVSRGDRYGESLSAFRSKSTPPDEYLGLVGRLRSGAAARQRLGGDLPPEGDVVINAGGEGAADGVDDIIREPSRIVEAVVR